MTHGTDLLDILKEEESVLRARAFDRLPELGRRKEAVSRLIGAESAPVVEAIREQAKRNERLFAIVLGAVRGLRTRLEKAGQSDPTVGYTSDGQKMSLGDGDNARRV
jgi:hypothetical protein